MLEGEPWFVAADVCRALGLGNSSQAIAKLDDDEKSGVIISDPHGREQVTRFISESGLYALVLSSRKPEAKAFKRWITHEVIPAIRKTGGYIAGQETMGSIIPTSSLRAKAMPLIQHRAMKLNSHLLMQWPSALWTVIICRQFNRHQLERVSFQLTPFACTAKPDAFPSLMGGQCVNTRLCTAIFEESLPLMG